MEKEKVAEKIKETYLSNILILSLTQQKHFCNRLFRVAGEQRYVYPIIVKHLADKKKFALILASLDKKENIERIAEKMYLEVKGKEGKWLKRKEMFANNKKILFYNLLSEEAFGWICNRIKQQEVEKVKNFFKKINLEKEYFGDSNILRYDPVHTINAIYYYDEMGLVSLKERVWEEFEKMYLASENFDDSIYENKVYGLTHFILADSLFYQRFVENGYSQIFDYFEKNLEMIMKRTNVDIVGEVGLCYKVCRRQSRVLDECINYVVNEFDEKAGMIRGMKNNDLSKAEHRNAVAYLLFCSNREYFSGPNLSKYNLDWAENN